MTPRPRPAAKRRAAPSGEAAARNIRSRASATQLAERPARSARPASPPSASALISARGLTKRYGSLTAVDSLDLDVNAGEIFGLLGQNGAGKTTTILMLLGLTEPTSGEALVVGLDPARHPLEVKRRVGYVPDNVGFYSDLSGRENLRYTARLNRIPRDDGEEAIDEVLEQVGLTARANDRVEAYSRGMLQRLGIADALVKDPDVLILDEPTTAIDPLGVVEILDLLRGLVRDRGMAILLSSHLLNQVQFVCDRIGIFAAGSMIGQGTMLELAQRFGDGTAHIEIGFEPGEAAGAARAAELIRDIDGIVEVRPGERPLDPWIATVKPPGAEGRVRREILGLAASNGLPLVSIRPVIGSLEEIYRQAVSRTLPAHEGAVQ